MNVLAALVIAWACVSLGFCLGWIARSFLPRTDEPKYADGGYTGGVINPPQPRT